MLIYGSYLQPICGASWYRRMRKTYLLMQQMHFNSRKLRLRPKGREAGAASRSSARKRTRRHLQKSIASEMLYSASGEENYKDFCKKLAYSPHVWSKECFPRYRSLFLSEATLKTIQDFASTLTYAAQSVWSFGDKMALDELLAGWSSQQFQDFLTWMDRKPHSPGLLYFLMVAYLNHNKKKILFCVDWEASIHEKMSSTNAGHQTTRSTPVPMPDVSAPGSDGFRFLHNCPHGLHAPASPSIYHLWCFQNPPARALA